MTLRSALILGLMASAAPCVAGPLVPEGGAVTGEHRDALAQVALPVGPWAGGQMPVETIRGSVAHTAWRTAEPRAPLALIAPLRAALEAEGFQTVFECADFDCGGFDFRFANDLLPEPMMHVDLGDFHWLTATKAGEAVALLASRSAAAGFVHITRVGPPAPEAEAETVTLSSRSGGSTFVDTLARRGRAVLEDLTFATGAARLDSGGGETLADLAGWLAANPGTELRLVGHTDSQGRLDRNIALSEARAAAVRDVLVADYAVDPLRVTVEGLGPSEPRASNDTAEGRRLNRRVEAILD